MGSNGRANCIHKQSKVDFNFRGKRESTPAGGANRAPVQCSLATAESQLNHQQETRLERHAARRTSPHRGRPSQVVTDGNGALGARDRGSARRP